MSYWRKCFNCQGTGTQKDKDGKDVKCPACVTGRVVEYEDPAQKKMLKDMLYKLRGLK